MARPFSEHKRTAILEAATDVVATHGVSAPTARIAKAAGVAEGTLFIYFASKDGILNALYLELKANLRDALSGGYPGEESLVERCRYVWDGYVRWGSANITKHKAIRQLALSDRITETSREAGRELLGVMGNVMRECAEAGSFKALPSAFTSSVMSSLADATIELMAQDPKKAKKLSQAGFEAFWRAIFSK